MKFLCILNTAAVLAIATIEPGNITFYNEVDWGGQSITEIMEFGECRAIPDSNAKGDSGSSLKVCLLFLASMPLLKKSRWSGAIQAVSTVSYSAAPLVATPNGLILATGSSFRE